MASLARLGKQLGSLGDKITLQSTSFRRGSKAAGAGDEGGGGGGAAGGGGNQAHAAAGILVGGQSTEDEAEAVLNSLAPGYFDPPQQFDALEHELRQLPINFQAAHLEAVAEERTAVLEVVSEKLSHHVIQNYDKFVAGVEEVTQVESDLQAAHVTTKQARERLALALREVNGNLKIAKDTRRKQGLTSLLEVLLKLQQAHNLQRALKEAQENGEYAEAFWLCAQCIKSMEELGDGLKVAQELTVTINRLYAETTERLETAMAAVCNDFRPSHYTKALEGYMFLGNVGQLGDEVKSAFVATINSSVAKVVRGVLLTRPGFEEKASVASNLQELLRFLPSDLFRTCLARVLMVLFDIMVSHFHMVRWHEAALERHQQELAGLQQSQQQLATQLRRAGSSGIGAGDSGSSAAAAAGSVDLLGLGDSGCMLSSSSSSLSHHHHQQQQQQQQQLVADELLTLGSSGEVTVTGRAVMQLQRGTASELEEVEARASDEEEWGTVLRAVHKGLLTGRQLIWDEAARRIGVLLSSPAAFEGEHFLQVMDWTQRALVVGESFSGVECASLRALLERQSGKFFRLYHHSNIEALSSMLDKEVWKRLPAALPSLAEALSARSSSDDGGGGGAGGSSSSALSEFEAHVVQGNPWRKQQSPRHKRPAQRQLGFGGSAGTDDSRGGRQLEVDEYGVPRTASSTPSAVGSQGGSMQLEAAAAAADEGPEEEEESEDVFGDFIDEDTQQVRTANGADGGADGAPAVTNSSWRMTKWMRDYSQLMRPLRAASPSIFAGLCELFELYMLHVFITFSDVSLAELQHHAAAQQQAAAAGALAGDGGSSGGGSGGGSNADSLTPRLRATLLRIAGESVGKYRQLFAAQSGSKLGRALASRDVSPGAVPALGGTTSSSGGSSSSTSQYFRRTMPGSAASSPAGAAGVGGGPSPGASPGAHTAAAAVASAGAQPAGEISVISNAGNLYGLLERTAAVQSLLAVAAQLQHARTSLSHVLPLSEGPALDSFYSRTVGAAEDLQDFVIRTGARLLLPLRWVPDRVGGANYVLSEPPTGHAPWVDELVRHLELFRDRLAQVPTLDHASVCRLWSAAAGHVAEACLEGIVRAKRCSLEGRAAMSVDLQGVGRALARLLPHEVPINMRLVDNYIKAFYIPLTELPHWAQTHPEYSLQQVLALTSCIAESSGMKKRDKAALMAQIEGDLRAMT